jgi:all-trans-retinol 13,14-reductase
VASHFDPARGSGSGFAAARSAADYDAVIVGGGIGGLVCAAYLAVAGRRVLLAEQHDVVGGNTQVFRRRRKYEFDVGVHYLGDCGPDGIIPAVLAGLGAADRIAFRPMDQDGFDLIRLPGLGVDVPADWDRYLARLQAALPGERDGLADCVRVLRAVADAVRHHLIGTSAVGTSAAGTPAAGSPHTMELIRQGSRSLGELFTACGLSSRAATMLAAQSGNYGTPPSTTLTSTHAAMMDHYLRGAYYPVGGGQMLAATLTEVIEAHGGTVRTRCPVDQILVSDDYRVQGVVLSDGDMIRAPIVVSNADYRHTVLRLCRGRGFPPSVVAKTRTATSRAAVAIAYVALDRPLDLPNANLWCWAHDDVEHSYAQAMTGSAAGSEAGSDRPPFVFLSFASLKDPGNRSVCPTGHSNFQVMTLVPPSPDADSAGYRRVASYLADKARLADSLVDAAEQAIGPFRDRITHLETATSPTNQRYTLSSSGSPYGLASWGGEGRRPDVRTSIDGLYLTGQNTRYGAGVAGTAISGITAAGYILDRRLLPEVHGGAVLGDSSLLPERGEDFDPLQVSRGLSRRTARGLARIG